ncbi:MAG TPA: GGDEF domain-containing protein [Acidobacteriaceae bacterium]|nr:GGDEF domain-containing protein [Acidobacteriaceae bacterium]
MLTYAIGFVQDVQLTCFAVVLSCMALQDRENQSLRWLAYGYIAGFAGAMLDLGGHWLPHWLSMGVYMEAAPVSYVCIYGSVAQFVRRGIRVRWLWLLLILGTLPFFVRWGIAGEMSASGVLHDALLALFTGLTAVLLLTTRDRETRWPRRAIAGFLGVFCSVEIARIALFAATGKMAGEVAPWAENASGIVYVVACSVLPLAFIWMMNARLLLHLNRQSMIDPLTELLNRRGLQGAAEVELARYARSGRDFAVVILDLDFFKLLNDRYGHAGGDAVLCEFSVFLRSMIRETDIAGRIGGEEFVLILPGSDGQTALATIERLRVAVAEHVFQVGLRLTRITASFGIAASAGRTDLTWDILQHEADLALYAAKGAGRNVARLYDESMAIEGPHLVQG